MSLCTPITKAQPLNYCGASTYGPGTLTIGTIDPIITDAIVVLQDLATGRITHHLSAVVAGVVTIPFPANLTPGRMYSVSLDGGIPFAIAGSSAIHTEVWVNMRKVFDADGEVVSAPTQTITA